MKVCAITGSTGILGKKIKKNLSYKFYEFKGDITCFKDVYKWIQSKNFDLLIHLAAIVPTKEVIKDYQHAYNVNVLGTKNIINGLKKKKEKPKWVFFASSSHVYQVKTKKILLDESSKVRPYSTYGLTKKLAEIQIKKLKNFDIKFCIGRIFSFTDKAQKIPFIIPSIIQKIKNSKKDKVIFKNLDHYRDFISTNDICKIIDRLYCTKSEGIFNIGSGQAINLKTIANVFAKKYKKKNIFEDNKKKTYLICDTRKIRKKKIFLKKFKNKIDYFYN